MKRVYLSVLTFSIIAVLSQVAWADKGGNGGDTFETRFRLAKTRVARILKDLTPEILAKEPYLSKLQTGDSALLLDKKDQWIPALQGAKISRSKTRLYNDDDCGKASVPDSSNEKAACTYKDQNEISLSIPYFDDFKVTPDEAFVLAFHESGHLVGIPDHQRLDRIGASLLEISSQTELKERLSQNDDPLEALWEIYNDKNVSSLPNLDAISQKTMAGLCFSGIQLTRIFTITKYLKSKGPLFSNDVIYRASTRNCFSQSVDSLEANPIESSLSCTPSDAGGVIQYDANSDAWVAGESFGIRGYGPYLIVVPYGRGEDKHHVQGPLTTVKNSACYLWQPISQ